jgi:hypothetical protein
MSICLAYYTLIINRRELRHGPETGAIDIRSIEVGKEGLIAGSTLVSPSAPTIECSQPPQRFGLDLNSGTTAVS